MSEVCVGQGLLDSHCSSLEASKYISDIVRLKRLGYLMSMSVKRGTLSFVMEGGAREVDVT
jgi:hypothetical protein